MSSKLFFKGNISRNFNFLLAIAGILICALSCRSECPPGKRIAAINSVHDAWSSWIETLNYMDDDVVIKSYDFLKCTINEARQCLEIRQDVTTRIDSVTMWYLSPDPTSDQMLKAEQWKEEIKTALH